MPTLKNEKRRSPRVPLNTSASLYTDRHRGTVFSDVVVANISETGVAMEGPVELNIGDHYPMRVCLPSGASIDGRAKIVWKNRAPSFSSYGAQLVEINWWDKRRLRSYIHRYEASGYPRSNSSYDRAAVACLALPAGAVWYHLIASFGWTMSFLGIMGIPLYFLMKLKSRRASVR